MNGEEKNLAVAIIPVDLKLNLKLAAKAAKAKKPRWPNQRLLRKPQVMWWGDKSSRPEKALPTFIHQSAQSQATICVSAGKRGLEIELSPQDLARLTRGQFADLCQEEN